MQGSKSGLFKCCLDHMRCTGRIAPFIWAILLAIWIFHYSTNFSHWHGVEDRSFHWNVLRSGSEKSKRGQAISWTADLEDGNGSGLKWQNESAEMNEADIPVDAKEEVENGFVRASLDDESTQFLESHGGKQRRNYDKGVINIKPLPTKKPVEEDATDLNLWGDGGGQELEVVRNTSQEAQTGDRNEAIMHYKMTEEMNQEVVPQDSGSRVDLDDDVGRNIGLAEEHNLAKVDFVEKKNCATVEEMGDAAEGETSAASLQVRRMIQKYISEHGADHVRGLPSDQFCRRGFVYARATEDGFGNDMYKILTAAGLSILLNRSLIIGEHGSTNPEYIGLRGHIRFPFGDYIKYSNQTFTMRHVKELWVTHNCPEKSNRPLIIRVDDFQKPTRTKVLCEDWTKWKHPIIWFKGTTDSTALQFFLKNKHLKMRLLASLILGDSSQPDSRANTFGELFHAFISPMPVVENAVQWALQGGPDPDVALHMRMLNSRSRRAANAACSCIKNILKNLPLQERLPRVVVVSDTPFVVGEIKMSLEGFAEVLHFDYMSFLRSLQNMSQVMSATSFQPPVKRVRDWGSMPRWVALVDFFLAARAKHAVVSGANRRVGTTYAQLLAALAAAERMDQGGGLFKFGFYSSFQFAILRAGLSGQIGWAHTWHRFGGPLSCTNQTNQCARTPLLPYVWWDGPLQSPVPRDIHRMQAYGIQLTETGVVLAERLKNFCDSRKSPIDIIRLSLPSCQKLKVCPSKNMP